MTTATLQKVITVTTVILAAFQPAWAEMRSWSSQDGRTIKGELVSYDAGTKKLTIKLAAGNVAAVAFDNLSKTDQDFLTERQRLIDEKFAAAKANAGKSVDYKSDGPEAVGYHVYYPKNYNPAAPPAMLIMFSANGVGNSILSSVKDTCEAMGWIGVGCDSFRNGADESELDRKWREVLPHMEKTVIHNPDLLYLGGFSGGALRAYDYSESSARPWKGVLAFGGWLGGKKTLHCAPKMAVAMVNGDVDKGANSNAESDAKVLKTAQCTVKVFSFPGGHGVGPREVIQEAMQWLKESTVPGSRLSAGKRSPTPRDPDLSKVK